MYILKSTNVKGDETSIPFRSLSKLIEAYRSEVKFNPARMYLYSRGELIELTA